MESVRLTATNMYNYYRPLLQRYARRLIKDETVSSVLTNRVLKDQFHGDGLTPSKHLRQVLKTDLLNRCQYFRNFVVFDRPPVKISEINDALDLYETDNKKNQL